MVFSNGSRHSVPAEMGQWSDYIESEVNRRQLKLERFSAKKGDVLIWNGNLLHGGGKIADPGRTRRSCVFHYYSHVDASVDFKLVPQAGGYWLDRPSQPLPPEIMVQMPFSEAAYLARYPDVAAAVKSGGFASGRAHFEHFGKAEGRIPN